MSAYDITEFLRTAYQPFAYCVPSKKTEYCVSKGGGVTLNYHGQTTEKTWTKHEQTRELKEKLIILEIRAHLKSTDVVTTLSMVHWILF